MLKAVATVTMLAAVGAVASAEDQPVPAAVKVEAPEVERRLAGAVERLAVSPDGRWIAASDARGSLTIFSAEGGEKRSVAAAGAAAFDQLLFTGDGAVLVAVPHAAADGTRVLRFIGTADGRELRTLDVSTKLDPKTRRPGGDSLHEVGAEPGAAKVRLLRQSTVEVWDAATGTKVESRRNEPYAQAFVQSADGALTASGATSQFRLVENASSKERWRIDLERVSMSGKKVETMWTGTCHVLGFTPDAGLVVVFSVEEETKDPTDADPDDLDKRTKKTTRIEGRSALDGKTAWKHEVSESAGWRSSFVAADTVAVVDDGKLTLLDAATGAVRETAPPAARYSCVAATRDGASFWAGTDDGRVVRVRTPAPKAK